MRGSSVPARLGAAAATLAAVLATAPASAAPSDVVVGSGPHEATRDEKGSTTLELTLSNISTTPLTVSLDDVTGCSQPTEEASLPPSSETSVTFTMACTAGDLKRTAVLAATPSTGTATTVEIPFALAGPTGPDGRPMAMFLVAVLLGLLATVLPYRFWKKNPRGNEPQGTSSGDEPVGTPVTPDQGDPRLSWTLPGVTKEWSFVDNWASNAGLATALFTGVFAAADPLEVLLGTDSSQAQSTVVVASALSAGLIGAAPLLLVIFRRRFRDEGGVARHHTVIGVLAATFVVITASTGLVLTAAAVLGGLWPWVAAVSTTAVLVVYAWKSIPQTLALGRYQEPGEQPVPWQVDLTTTPNHIGGTVVRGPAPEGEPSGGLTRRWLSGRRDSQVSGMP